VRTWTKEKIEVKGFQLIPERMAELGLSDEDGLHQAWFVAADGRLFGGPEAINLSLRYVWWAWPLTWLYYIPGIRYLQNRVYRWIADNRHRMPGASDSCAIDPSAKPNE